MLKHSEKIRKLLRNIFRGLGVTATALVFQACYGMPPDLEDNNQVLIRGVVISKEGKTVIPGIKVSVSDFEPCYLTNNNGSFYLYVPIQDTYQVIFEDIDGEKNGSFKPHSEEIAYDDIDYSFPLHVYLDEDE